MPAHVSCMSASGLVLLREGQYQFSCRPSVVAPGLHSEPRYRNILLRNETQQMYYHGYLDSIIRAVMMPLRSEALNTVRGWMTRVARGSDRSALQVLQSWNVREDLELGH